MKKEMLKSVVEEALKPLILKLYEEAKLEVPEKFDAATEAERVICALRCQGFSARLDAGKGPR
jgi:hypothetical protein